MTYRKLLNPVHKILGKVVIIEATFLRETHSCWAIKMFFGSEIIHTLIILVLELGLNMSDNV